MDLLREDIVNRTSLVAVNLTQHQRDALTCLCFTIGTTNFAKSSVMKHVNGGKFETACEFFGHWRLANGTIVPGLCMRRLAEVCIFANTTVDPMSSDPPSIQWENTPAGTPPDAGTLTMPIADDTWKRMSIKHRRRAVSIYEAYWKE